MPPRGWGKDADQGRPVGFMVARKEEDELEALQLDAEPGEEAVVESEANISEERQDVGLDWDIVHPFGWRGLSEGAIGHLEMEVAKDLDGHRVRVYVHC